MREFDLLERADYTHYSNRQLAAVPLAVLAVALLVIGGMYVTTGMPVEPGIEFTGGTELQVAVGDGDTAADVEAAFDEPVTSVQSITAVENEYVVTFQSTDADALEAQAQAAGFEVTAVQSTSPSFGQTTQLLAIGGIGVAFVGMSIIVFVLFRTFIPSIAVVLSAFSDIVVPVALMNLTGIKLSLGTVAALLMLIGYSVDSDILLNNHILRRRGKFYESTASAMRTGVTMTLTSLAAVTVMAVVSYVFGVDLLTSIGVVLAFGLATDLMNTYMMNLSLLRWYRGLPE